MLMRNLAIHGRTASWISASMFPSTPWQPRNYCMPWPTFVRRFSEISRPPTIFDPKNFIHAIVSESTTIHQLMDDLNICTASIKSVEVLIEKVTEDIAGIETKLVAASSSGNFSMQPTQSLTENEYLRVKEVQLRKEKEDLRKKEALLLLAKNQAESTFALMYSNFRATRGKCFMHL